MSRISDQKRQARDGHNQTPSMISHLPAAYRAFINANGVFEGFVVMGDEEQYIIE